MNNIEIFHDTQDRIMSNPTLRYKTDLAMLHTHVIDEGFVSKKKPFFDHCRVTFEENVTLLAAARYVDAGKRTAVLNFANPIEPGGGVLRGANAQEEYMSCVQFIQLLKQQACKSILFLPSIHLETKSKQRGVFGIR